MTKKEWETIVQISKNTNWCRTKILREVIKLIEKLNGKIVFDKDKPTNKLKE